jgi:hypothetical protein
MRRWVVGLGVLLVASLLTVAGMSGAAMVRVGTLVLHADGSFEPRLLPKRAFAPIRFQGYGEVTTTNGSIPPAVEHVELEFDRDGHLTTAGLPVCSPSKLEGATPKQARSRCSGSIVGTGHLAAAVSLAGLARITLRSPLTIFNGTRQDGNPTAVLHAQAPFPVSETYVIVAPIERRNKGIYGYRTEFDIPPIAGGLGSLTRIDSKIGRFYRAGGVERSYVSARCSDYILQTQGYFSFADGNVIYGSVFKACVPRP